MELVGTVKPQVCLRDIKSRMNFNFLLLSLGQKLFLEINSSGIDELITSLVLLDFFGVTGGNLE